MKLDPDLAPHFNLLHPFDWIDHLWISGLDEGVCENDDGWFPQAARSAAVTFDGLPLGSMLSIDDYPSGCFAEGATLLQFSGIGCENARGAVAPISGLSLIAYEPFETAATWSGNLAELQIGVDPQDQFNRAMILREQGDASFFKDIAWAGEAAEISFDYLFLAPLGMESLTVYLGDEIVYYDNADVSLATAELTSSGPIYVGQAAGTSARLNFVVRTDQGEGGQFGGAVVLDNLRVYGLRPGDIDFDGDRDLIDFQSFQRCFRNDNPPADCPMLDFNGDGLVSAGDYLGDPAAPIPDGFFDLLDGPRLLPIP